MKRIYRFVYFISSCIIYILLGIFEFFYLNNLVDILSTSYLIHVFFMFLTLLVINPIITFKLISLIPIKPIKKIKSLNEELKQEVNNGTIKSV